MKDSGKEFEVVKYLEDVPSKEELRLVLQYLGVSAENLVRKNEAIWKEKYRNRLLTDDEILDAMVENPKLIERPIVIKNNTAVIGRPPENIKTLIS